LVFDYLLYNFLFGFWNPFHLINPYVFGDLKWVVGLVRTLKPTLNLLPKKTQARTIDWVYKRYVKPKAMGYIFNKGYVILVMHGSQGVYCT
jgi:hypothetical protein